MFSKKPEFERVELNAISGKRCRYYTILLKDGQNLFGQFVEQNSIHSKKDVMDLVMRLKEMASAFGARDDYFKMNYGSPGDGVCALKARKLRLICLKFSTVAVILGSGAIKNTRSVQEEIDLEPHRQFMVYLSAKVIERMKNKDIRLVGDQLVGNLKFYNEEQ